VNSGRVAPLANQINVVSKVVIVIDRPPIERRRFVPPSMRMRMNFKKSTCALLGVLLVGSFVSAATNASFASPAPPKVPLQGVDAKADRILRQMGDYLSSADELTFRTDLSYDVVGPEGQSIQYGAVTNVAVRRPGGLHVEYDGDERRTSVVFDGKAFTIYDAAVNVYTVADVPGTLDDALDAVFDRYGISVPIADLFYADPYGVLIENAQSGFVVGQHPVDGVLCDHLAFSQDGIDWQIWIEAGPRPVPRKLVITYKDETASPQYSATLSAWDFNPRLSDRYFEFVPPPGSDQIEFLPAQPEEIRQ